MTTRSASAETSAVGASAVCLFSFASRRRHTRYWRDWSSDVCSSDLKNLLAKETQPPGRYGQGRLIQLMEDLGLGTKATRPSIIQNLYDRGYVHDDPLVPTETGMAVAKALKDFASEIATHEMTAELERSMDEISEGTLSKDSVVDRSRDVLRQVYEHLESSQEEFAGIVRSGIREDSVLGPCPNCGKNLIVRQIGRASCRERV